MADPARPDGSGLRWLHGLLPEKVGEGLFGPMLPVFAATLVGATPARIGLMEATFQALTVLGALAWGRTSDQVGKRKAFIVLGMAGAGASLLGMAYSDSFWALFAWRGIYGFMVAAFAAVGGALVADQSTPATIGDRMGLLRTVGGVGYVLGLLGGALLVFARPTTELFALAGVLAVVSAAALWRWIEEPAAHLEPHEVARLFRNVRVPLLSVQRRLYTPTMFLSRPRLVGTERRAWAYLGAIGLSFVGTTAGIVLFPLYLSEELGLSSPWIFGLFILNAGLSAALYRPMGRWADRIGYRPMQLGAIGTRSAMYLVLVLPFLTGLTAAATFLALAGVSWAVLNVTGPAALFRSMRIREKGELIGLYTVAAGLGSLVGALLGGLLAQRAGYLALFVVSAGIVAVSLVILARAVYPRGGVDAVDPPSAGPEPG